MRARYTSTRALTVGTKVEIMISYVTASDSPQIYINGVLVSMAAAIDNTQTPITNNALYVGGNNVT
jgi:hypothetical protein